MLKTTIYTLSTALLLSCANKTDESMTKENDKKVNETDSNENKLPDTTITQQTGSLGAFSMSLTVKDLSISKKFYEDLGFEVFGGGMEMNYLIMKNGNTLIGLFQGMFDGNILTFNPGWDESAKNLEKFTDVRTIQQNLKDNGVSLEMEADTNSTGPASIMLKDPDGNMILIDQHR